MGLVFWLFAGTVQQCILPVYCRQRLPWVPAQQVQPRQQIRVHVTELGIDHVFFHWHGLDLFSEFPGIRWICLQVEHERGVLSGVGQGQKDAEVGLPEPHHLVAVKMQAITAMGPGVMEGPDLDGITK